MRRAGLARSIVGHAQSEKTRDTALRLGLVDSVYATRRRGRARRRSRHPVRAGRRLRRHRPRDGARPASRRHPDRRRLGQGRDRARRGPVRAQGRALHPRPPDRRHRALGPRIRLRRAVRRPLVHPDAAGGRRSGGRRQARRVLAGAAASHVEIMDARAPRPGARHHQPRAAPHRLQHRQHGAAPGARDRHRGDQVLGRRLPRLHAHRRLRSRHVARRVPQQQGGGAGDARPLHRGPDGAAARHPLRRRRHAASSCSSRRARSGAASSRPARIRPRPISAGRHGSPAKQPSSHDRQPSTICGCSATAR